MTGGVQMNFSQGVEYELKLNLHSKVMLAFRYGIAIEGVICGGENGVLIRDPQAFIDRGFEPMAMQPFDDLALETEYSYYENNRCSINIEPKTDIL